MRSALETVAPQVIKVSVLPTAACARAVAAELNAWRRKTGGMAVYDPVLEASVGGRLSEAPGDWLRGILAAADVATPNLSEARTLAGALGAKQPNGESPADCASAISSAMAHDGPAAVVVKSASPGSDLVVGRSGGRGSPLDEVLLRGAPSRRRVHGTGCAHSTALAVHLSFGMPVPKAAAIAKWYVESLVLESSSDARPRGSLELVQPGRPWSALGELFAGVARAAADLERTLGHDVLPEVGTNIAYALPFASGLEEVVALDSRIVRHRAGVRTHGEPALKVDSHMARMALAASNADPAARSCCNLRYSEVLVAAARDARLRVVELDRTLETQGETMRWLISQASAGRPHLPDAIYDTGAPGKEAMVRFLGRDPGEVVQKVRRSVRGLRRRPATDRPRKR
jgi:hydroxymethylpyrimidine/phosphomethylpyrimidine kinase